jgi:hypothetical protein
VVDLFWTAAIFTRIPVGGADHVAAAWTTMTSFRLFCKSHGDDRLPRVFDDRPHYGTGTDPPHTASNAPQTEGRQTARTISSNL